MNSWLIHHTRLIEVLIVVLILGFFAFEIWNESTKNNYYSALAEKASVEVYPEKIKIGQSVKFTYGYLDKTNNEHLASATTMVIVETPSKKKYQAVNAKVFPDDFPEASTNEKGIYVVDVERTVKRTDGSIDILYKAVNVFSVDE